MSTAAKAIFKTIGKIAGTIGAAVLTGYSAHKVTEAVSRHKAMKYAVEMNNKGKG